MKLLACVALWEKFYRAWDAQEPAARPAFARSGEAGYSRWTARAFGKLLRGSWGLREAIRISMEQTGRYLIARPVRRRSKYDRRSLALNVRQCVAPPGRPSVHIQHVPS